VSCVFVFVCVLENEIKVKKSNASVVASRLMPPNIPGARKGVRPPKGSRKANARAHKFPSKGKSRGNNADGDGGSSGVGLFAALAAAVVAVVTITLRTNAEHNARNKSIRDRLRSKPRAVSEHAACRMDCRFITSRDVEQTLVDGTYDAKHSTPNARPCPRVALNSGRVRAIWADCRDDTRLVTVIDTETNHPCGAC